MAVIIQSNVATQFGKKRGEIRWSETGTFIDVCVYCTLFLNSDKKSSKKQKNEPVGYLRGCVYDIRLNRYEAEFKVTQMIKHM